jgi:hypothetical protein
MLMDDLSRDDKRADTRPLKSLVSSTTHLELTVYPRPDQIPAAEVLHDFSNWFSLLSFAGSTPSLLIDSSWSSNLSGIENN